MATPNWTPLARDYEKDAAQLAVQRVGTTTHPLSLTARARPAVTVSEKVLTTSTGRTVVKTTASFSASSSSAGPLSVEDNPLLDPLSAAVAVASHPGNNAPISPLHDPLSDDSLSVSLSHTHVHSETETHTERDAAALSASASAQAWQRRKAQIRKEYSMSGTLTLSSAAIRDFVGSGVEDGSRAARVDNTSANASSSSSQASSKYDKRLAHLEQREASADEKISMSQREYEAHVARLSADLQRAWSRDERVASLKIAIQLAKLLGDTTMPLVYPSIFAIVSEALDAFGVMVFERLRNRAEEVLPGNNASSESSSTQNKAKNAKNASRLSESFTCDDVPLLAKDTCRNWFYKISCIRELLPRIYVEIALLRCYRFLAHRELLPAILNRISSLIRGLGDCVVACYARMYLAVTAEDVLASVPPLKSLTLAQPQTPSPASSLVSLSLSMLEDSLFTLSMLRDASSEESFAAELARKNLSQRSYHFVIAPAIDWMIGTLAKHRTSFTGKAGVDVGGAVTANSGKELFQTVLQLYRDRSGDSFMLYSVLQHFDASLYAHACVGMLTLVKACTPCVYSTVELCEALGRQLAAHPPPEETRLSLLNDVWKLVSKNTPLSSPTGPVDVPALRAYIKCTAAWLETVRRHYSEREVLVLLAQLAQRISAAVLATQSVDSAQQTHAQENALDALQPELETLLLSLLSPCAPLSLSLTNTQGSSSETTAVSATVLTSDHVLKILDVFKGAKKVQLSKEILTCFKSQSSTNDPVLINIVFDLARVVHDAIDGLSAPSETQLTGALLCGFVDQIDFGRDLEAQLGFYVDCRAAFANLESVKDKLVVCVAALAMKAFKYVKGKHTKKTTTFVKAALAYCHITIPSLSNVFRKLELLLQCAQIALLNQCLPQTDTFLKAAISLIPELVSSQSTGGVSEPSEERVAEYVHRLLGFLVLAPGHPEHGPFYIVQGLLNALPKYPWQAQLPHKPRVYVSILLLLCAFRQKTLPYRIAGVQSNDELYGGAPGYLHELHEMVASVIAEILQHMSALAETQSAEAKLQQARTALDLANALVASMELRADLVEFVYKLLDLAGRQKASLSRVDLQLLRNIVHSLSRNLEDSTETFAPVAITKLQAFIK